jgi:hypothetical protein
MNRNLQDEMRCSQFEALLAEALDGDQEAAGQEAAEGMGREGAGLAGLESLSPEIRQAFEAHRASCAACAPLYAEAREGMLLLRTMENVEPPRNLVHNILAATSRAEVQGAIPARSQVQPGLLDRLRQGLRPTLGGLMHSRFVTSFCMAFFSISLTLSLTGVKIGNIDWHPSALRKSAVLEYTQIEARVMRYYDNMRLVYEVQSRVQKLRQATAPAPNQDNTQPQQQNQKHAPGAGQPEPEENYSQERDGSLVAQLTKPEGAQL